MRRTPATTRSRSEARNGHVAIAGLLRHPSRTWRSYSLTIKADHANLCAGTRVLVVNSRDSEVDCIPWPAVMTTVPTSLLEDVP